MKTKLQEKYNSRVPKDKQIINLKRYIKFGEKLDDIVKYTIGWKKQIKAKKSE